MRTAARHAGLSGQRIGHQPTRPLLCYAILVGFLAAVFDVSAASAGVPHFQGPPVISPFGLIPVDFLDNHTAPAVADLDADGDADFLIGAEAGDLFFYENTGSATAPAFGPTADMNPFGLVNAGARATPAFGDLDGDGVLDLIVGNSTGSLQFFRNTGTSSAPAFAAPLLNPFGLMPMASDSAPALVDIDADGDLDLFVGVNTGATFFFRNTGTSTAPAFAAGEVNAFGLTSVELDAAPSFADIDGDGLLDVFVGNDLTSIVYFANRGSATTPAFANALVDPFGITPSFGGLPALVDITDDGFIDLFVGRGSYIGYYANGPIGAAPAPAMAPWAIVAALGMLASVALGALKRR